mmetsp:Transcript_19981/g.56605  ORF Transcript_19981/g.56605 Transcript_19981/m.56605 type:complete len:327 (-) Transcript_19981:1761-2741(-)
MDGLWRGRWHQTGRRKHRGGCTGRRCQARGLVIQQALVRCHRVCFWRLGAEFRKQNRGGVQLRRLAPEVRDAQCQQDGFPRHTVGRLQLEFAVGAQCLHHFGIRDCAGTVGTEQRQHQIEVLGLHGVGNGSGLQQRLVRKRFHLSRNDLRYQNRRHNAAAGGTLPSSPCGMRRHLDFQSERSAGGVAASLETAEPCASGQGLPRGVEQRHVRRHLWQVVANDLSAWLFFHFVITIVIMIAITAVSSVIGRSVGAIINVIIVVIQIAVIRFVIVDSVVVFICHTVAYNRRVITCGDNILLVIFIDRFRTITVIIRNTNNAPQSISDK